MNNQNQPTTATQRLEMLFDNGSCKQLNKSMNYEGNPLGVITGYGTVEGMTVFAFVQDSEVSGGVVNKAHTQKIVNLYEMALKVGAPVVGIYDSKGGYIGHGSQIMDHYSQVISAITRVSGVIPQVSVIVGNCGGAMALAACSADFVIMSENGKLFMTSPFSQKTGQSAEDAYKHGVVAQIGKDDMSAIKKARDIIAFMPENNLEKPPCFDIDINVQPISNITDASQAIDQMADTSSIKELYGDFGKSSKVAFATVAGMATGLISVDGKINRDDSSKISRFVSICDSFQIPVAMFLDSEGFDFEENSDASALREMAKLSHIIHDATIAKIAVVVGKGYGASYIALAGSADIKIALPTAVISPLSPKAAVVILCEDQIDKNKPRAQVESEYIEEHLTGLKMAETGMIDQVVEPSQVRNEIIEMLQMLSEKRVSRLAKKHANIPM